MKKILLFSFLAAISLAFYGCEHGLDKNAHDEISTENLRSVALDPVADCVLEQVHQHNGVYYSGHYNNDEHGHHGLVADNVCILANCQETGLHQHNGMHYAGHNKSCNHGSKGHYRNSHR